MNRHEYILKRLGLSLVAIFFVVTIVFLLFRTIPGDPTTTLAGPDMSKESRELMLEQFGLNQPLHMQYLLYMKNLVTGHLGISYTHNAPVTPLLVDKALNTISLMVPAVVLAFIIGPIIGAFLAWHRNSRIDTYGIGVVLLMHAMPVFWTGMLGIMVFSFWLGWLPSGGMHGPGFISDSLIDRFVSLDFLRHLVLPLSVTTLYWLSVPSLIMRNNMVDVMGSDFIEMCRAEGIGEFRTLYRHAARNALLPVLHYSALAIGFAFGGSVVIESVFSWPGIGRFMWDAVLQRDYPLAQGAFIMLGCLIILLNFLADILSVYVDPRVEVVEA